MTWEQFAVFVFAMIMVNVLTQAVIRGFFGVHGKDNNGKNSDSVFYNRYTFSTKVDDMLKEISYLKNALNDKVCEDVCEARMDKLEAVIEEIKKRLDSIEKKIDKVLENNRK